MMDTHEDSPTDLMPMSREPRSEQSLVFITHVPVSIGSSVSPSSTNSSISTEADAQCDMLDTGRDYMQGPPTKKPRLNQVMSGPKLQERSKSQVLLAREHDDVVLNPMHVFVRNQIEVFTASPAELALPAPGRKHPIKLHQVGLRCIHCVDVPSRKRVKRAVCYPSSVGKLYHSVSDMKFDHFSSCKNLPGDVRSKFEALKAEGKRTSDKKSKKGLCYASSTAQYYHDAAVQMGMKDGPGGIFMTSGQCLSATATPVVVNLQTGASLDSPEGPMRAAVPLPTILTLPVNTELKNVAIPRKAPRQDAVQREHVTGACISSGQLPSSLASPADNEHLNQLHCFVRRNVELFAASEEDIAAPAPGRKNRVGLGQVGIRCIHCAKLPIKERVKRAVCYPPSVGGIYHSVSNMKFDHFALCRGLPAKDREEFALLKSNCVRRGTAGTTAPRGMATSTAQYYHDSALAFGLVDTPTGIRVSNIKAFLGDQVNTTQKRQGPALTGLSALVMAASQVQNRKQ